LSNSYFVTKSTTIKVYFEQNGKIAGNRFLLKAVIGSNSLDKDGFVVDFSKINDILVNVKEILEEGSLNLLLEGEFSYKKLLDKIVSIVSKQLESENSFLRKIVLEGDNEGYEIEVF